MIIRYSSPSAKRKARVHHRLRTQKRPRLSVFRSNKKISAQIIDDNQKLTLVSVSQKQALAGKDPSKISKTEAAKKVGQLLAQKALKAKITQVAFDRGSYKYHGRIKALAEAARNQGLKF